MQKSCQLFAKFSREFGRNVLSITLLETYKRLNSLEN